MKFTVSNSHGYIFYIFTAEWHQSNNPKEDDEARYCYVFLDKLCIAWCYRNIWERTIASLFVKVPFASPVFGRLSFQSARNCCRLCVDFNYKTRLLYWHELKLSCLHKLSYSAKRTIDKSAISCLSIHSICIKFGLLTNLHVIVLRLITTLLYCLT